MFTKDRGPRRQNMAKHQFGGSWTEQKLERVRKYLGAYTKIFRQNSKARYFRTTYVDGFAGTGHRAAPSESDSGLAVDDDAEALKKGSARIALEIDPSFDRYVFVERDKRRIGDLEALRDSFPSKASQIRIENDDANSLLKRWCAETDWNQNRAVVFLDPYGMQVEWATVEAVARTQAIDFWILFPLGMAINRLLTRDEPPPDDWGEALTRAFGTNSWREAFYSKTQETTLFGIEESERKNATLNAIGAFFIKRLKSVFAGVAENSLSLKNSTGSPIFLLCFAAGNPKGAKTAVKIAQDILAG